MVFNIDIDFQVNYYNSVYNLVNERPFISIYLNNLTWIPF